LPIGALVVKHYLIARRSTVHMIDGIGREAILSLKCLTEGHCIIELFSKRTGPSGV
jgi:hypothetical protein